ncbi:hypothetical protein [Streptomyces oceani]|uniref:hypothetical protein n=1 Tax=Streptomyces oceani TaxID=1075402 RepID=UPI001112DE95|nr:hypothetical protein [Streptomyces oceani]
MRTTRIALLTGIAAVVLAGCMTVGEDSGKASPAPSTAQSRSAAPGDPTAGPLPSVREGLSRPEPRTADPGSPTATGTRDTPDASGEPRASSGSAAGERTAPGPDGAPGRERSDSLGQRPAPPPAPASPEASPRRVRELCELGERHGALESRERAAQMCRKHYGG